MYSAAAGPEIHIFTTENAPSTFFIEKVRRKLQACRGAVWPGILAVEKVPETRLELNILSFSKFATRRYFEF